MKKLLFVFMIIVFAINLKAQEEFKIIYCELLGTSMFNKVTVVIDMGEEKGFLGMNSSLILDEETGKPKKFNSMIDAMNFMGDIGWEFVQAYVITIGQSSVYHWLLKQTIIKGSDGQYYPATLKNFKEREPNKN